jgi:hypothetical protein
MGMTAKKVHETICMLREIDDQDEYDRQLTYTLIALHRRNGELSKIVESLSRALFTVQQRLRKVEEAVEGTV